MLLFVVWQLWGTGLSEHRAQASLATQFAHEVKKKTSNAEPPPSTIPADKHARRPASTPSGVAPPTLKPGLGVDPPAGAAVGKLEIPAIGLSQIVVEGTDEDDLAEGPGHYIGTALPGYSGNVAIAGHRTTYGAPFNRLAEVAKGDMIFLTATDGAVLPYRVVATPSAVAPTDVSVLGDFDDNRVTLTTCTPEFSAAQRLVVVADFVGAATSSATAPTASTTGSAPTRLQGPSLSPAVAKVLARWAADRGARSRAPKVGAPPSGAASGSGRPDRGNSPRSVSATITENAVTQGWNLDGLPSVTRWVILLVVLGAIYGRVRRRLGWAAFAVLVPAWGLGLYFLFQALAGFLPAGM